MYHLIMTNATFYIYGFDMILGVNRDYFPKKQYIFNGDVFSLRYGMDF
jgi:hypothetical protein